MKWSLKNTVLTLVVAMLFVSTAQAKQTKLRVKDHGVLGAMQRMGCRAEWLPVVMHQSYLLEYELNSLPQGKVITMPDNCGAKPAKSTARSSRRLLTSLAKQQDVLNENKTLAVKLKDTEAKLSTTEQAYNSLLGTNTGLRNQNTDLQNQLKSAKEALESTKWRYIITGSVYGGVVGIVLVFALLWFILISPLRREIRDSRETISELEREAIELREKQLLSADDFVVENDGRIVKFRNTSVLSAGCPYCTETNIKPSADNLRQHLRKVHNNKDATTRVTTVS